MTNLKWTYWNRKTHYWGAILCAIPVLLVIGTGVLLLLKKESDWIQPPSMRGQGTVPQLAFSDILAAAQKVPQAKVTSWGDIDRLDVRPEKGIVKIRAQNDWEIQIDHQTGAILQVAFRRSGTIEAIHDGTYFHDAAKLWIFLPSSLVLFVLSLSGLYMFFFPIVKKRQMRKRAKAAQAAKASQANQ